MLIIALVLAVIGLAALVTAVVTSNELIAWVCIGASVVGVILLIVDALRERSRSASGGGGAGPASAAADGGESAAVDYPDEDEPEQRPEDTAELAHDDEAAGDEGADDTSDEAEDAAEVADDTAGEQKN